jgi:hypothetical protein
MKIALLVVLLLGLGVGGLIMLINSGGAAQSSLSFARLLDGEGTDEDGRSKLVSLTCQIAEMHSKFKPIEFDAIDVGKRENETEEEKEARFRSNPRVRVVYQGHDKLLLSNYNHVHIIGRWDPEAKVFKADSLSTQCPSHYEEKGPTKPSSQVQR